MRGVVRGSVLFLLGAVAVYLAVAQNSLQYAFTALVAPMGAYFIGQFLGRRFDGGAEANRFASDACDAGATIGVLFLLWDLWIRQHPAEAFLPGISQPLRMLAIVVLVSLPLVAPQAYAFARYRMRHLRLPGAIR
jgi:hypothetical protein